MKVLSRSLSVLFLLVVSSLTASACQCIEYFTPACAQFQRADAVFTVFAMDFDQRPDEDGRYPDGTKVRLLVEEVLRGKVGKEVFDTQSNGADCKLTYEKGGRYLIYDYGYDPQTRMIATSYCGGSTNLESAQDDIEYIRSLKRKPPPPSVMGRVLLNRYEALQDVVVSVESKRKKVDSTTNQDGDFEVKLDKPGKYKVTVVVPFAAGSVDFSDFGPKVTQGEPTETATMLSYEVDVGPGQCGYKQVNVFKVDLKATASVAGRVTGSDGKPVANLTVYLYRVEDIDKQGPNYEFGITDDRGFYKIEGLRPGGFYIGVNIRHHPEISAPYPATFYPGVAMVDQARVISLGHEQSLQSIDLQLPPKLIEREITGRIVWPNGSPVTKLSFDPETVIGPSISIKDATTLQHVSQLRGVGNSAEKVDDKGNFSITLFEGHSYVISARAFDQHDNAMRSKFVKIVAGENLKPITLVLSIPADQSPADEQIRREIGENP